MTAFSSQGPAAPSTPAVVRPTGLRNCLSVPYRRGPTLSIQFLWIAEGGSRRPPLPEQAYFRGPITNELRTTMSPVVGAFRFVNAPTTLPPSSVGGLPVTFEQSYTLPVYE